MTTRLAQESSYEAVLKELPLWWDEVQRETRAAVGSACLHHPSLRRIVEAIVLKAEAGYREAGAAGFPQFRLFGMAVLGALTGDPRPAAPVCAAARLWWAGAEALDDLTDRQSALIGSTPSPTLAQSHASHCYPRRYSSGKTSRRNQVRLAT